MLSRTLLVTASAVLLAAGAAFAQSAPPSAPPGDVAPSAPQDRDRSRAGDAMSSGIAACRADMASLCRGDGRDTRGARMQCLIDNRDRVSPACADMLAAIEQAEPRRQRRAERRGERQFGRDDGRWGDRRAERRGDMRDEPRDGGWQDPRRFGEGPRPGPGSGQGSGQSPQQACRADAQALCGSVERGPQRRQCLMQHEAQLSPGCKAAITAAASQRHELREACRTDRQTLCAGAATDGRQPGNRGGMMRCLADNEAKLSTSCSAALARMPAFGGDRGRRAAVEPGDAAPGLPR